VRLNVPENPRLHGAPAVVREATAWGAHVGTAAAATGRFRALASEMDPAGGAAREQGYTGDCCDCCGGCRMRRNGACLLCEDCGSTSGCS
jgi:ribonucleoside-diphosphate reductase alpha chain